MFLTLSFYTKIDGLIWSDLPIYIYQVSSRWRLNVCIHSHSIKKKKFRDKFNMERGLQKGRKRPYQRGTEKGIKEVKIVL